MTPRRRLWSSCVGRAFRSWRREMCLQGGLFITFQRLGEGERPRPKSKISCKKSLTWNNQRLYPLKPIKIKEQYQVDFLTSLITVTKYIHNDDMNHRLPSVLVPSRNVNTPKSITRADKKKEKNYPSEQTQCLLSPQRPLCQQISLMFPSVAAVPSWRRCRWAW